MLKTVEENKDLLKFNAEGIKPADMFLNARKVAVKAVDDYMKEKEETNEEETKVEEVVDRQDGFVPATLKYEVGEFAEGTEIQVDAEDYTTSGQDESITVFVKDSEKPIKINKRDILLADRETV